MNRQKDLASAVRTGIPVELDPGRDGSGRDAMVAIFGATIASLCVMAMEIGAGRILTRHHGASLATWTTVIGVILSGLTLGNLLGGRLADRRPWRQSLANLLAAASIAGLLVLGLENRIVKWGWLWDLSWRTRIATHMAVLFLVPSVVMGMVGPVAARIALRTTAHAGRMLGSLSAWSTIGSIAGTFLAGFYLIAKIGPSGLLWGATVVLAAAGIAVAQRRRFPAVWGVAVIVCLAAGVGPWGWARRVGESAGLRESKKENILFEKESQYSNVRIVELEEQPGLRYLYLDKLLHSQMIVNEPDNLLYEYEQMFAVLTKRFSGAKSRIATLTIGGGGCVFPAYINRHWPGSHTDVAEIDPAVTEAARIAFGADQTKGLNLHHLDGRNFVETQVRRKQSGLPAPAYDFIYGDAFNDVAVPYHLTTVEFVEKLATLLSEDGLYLANVIDNFNPGDFLATMLETIGRVFPHTYVISPVEDVSEVRLRSRTTFVIVGSRRVLDLSGLRLASAGMSREAVFWQMKDSQLGELRARCTRVALTDDRAPVDQLLEHLQETQVTPNFQPYHDRAVKLAAAHDVYGAIAAYRRALQVHPMCVSSMNGLANLLMTTNQIAEAAALYQKALDFTPRNYKLICNYGNALNALGHPDLAIAQYRLATQVKSDFALAHNNLGVGLARKGNFEEAAKHFSEALASRNDYVEARSNLGSALASLGRYAEAGEHFSEVVRARPEDADARCNLGAALADQGKVNESIEQYRAALRINSQHARTLSNLAWLEATSAEDRLRNGTEAVQLAEQFVRISGDQDPAALDVLAAALAEAGRFDQAVGTAERAAALASQSKEDDLAKAIRGRLETYRAGRPYREGGQKKGQP